MGKILKDVVLLPLNVKNKNERYYVEDSFNDIKDKYYGEIGFSNDIKLSNVSHSVTNIKINNNKITGDVNILNTIKGKLLLLFDNVELVFRPRSISEVIKGKVMNSKIISFVAIPKKEDTYCSVVETS